MPFSLSFYFWLPCHPKLKFLSLLTLSSSSFSPSTFFSPSFSKLSYSVAQAGLKLLVILCLISQAPELQVNATTPKLALLLLICLLMRRFRSWAQKWVIMGIVSHCDLTVTNFSLGSWAPPPCYSSRNTADLKWAGGRTRRHSTLNVYGQLELACFKLLVDLRIGTQGLHLFIYGLWWVVFWGCPSSLNILKCSSLDDQLQVPQKMLASQGYEGYQGRLRLLKLAIQPPFPPDCEFIFLPSSL